MKQFSRRVALVALVGTQMQAVAWAAERTVTLSVPGMYCALCPVTVKAALSRVSGVVNTQASFAAKEVVVTFDDRKTTEAALMKATGEAGFTSTVKK